MVLRLGFRRMGFGVPSWSAPSPSRVAASMSYRHAQSCTRRAVWRSMARRPFRSVVPPIFRKRRLGWVFESRHFGLLSPSYIAARVFPGGKGGWPELPAAWSRWAAPLLGRVVAVWSGLLWWGGHPPRGCGPHRGNPGCRLFRPHGRALPLLWLGLLLFVLLGVGVGSVSGGWGVQGVEWDPPPLSRVPFGLLPFPRRGLGSDEKQNTGGCSGAGCAVLSASGRAVSACALVASVMSTSSSAGGGGSGLRGSCGLPWGRVTPRSRAALDSFSKDPCWKRCLSSQLRKTWLCHGRYGNGISPGAGGLIPRRRSAASFSSLGHVRQRLGGS